ncbi:MAG TPA: bifunctional DNA-formamidopyrimidine glycosylase/DNA-(apurinic or apyrimidinic site) lyase [Solirubrobacteraceae bacterium]|nr:bifunctional DNA-formamidopyrimidine glycosylase/DNA-(apurinic or apyrimidinic site) lyase [Solirubrobacteraceae bacterium]
MPELPEVETIRGQVAPRVVGRRLAALEILDPRWCEPLAPEEVADAVVGRRIERLERRGKYLIWAFAGDVFLLMHLRMTGTLLYDPPGGVAAYARVRILLDDGHALVFADPRRFGTGQLVIGDAALEAFLEVRLGIEPLQPGFTSERLRALAGGSRAPVKAFLLNQRRIAGVGNIYADEALFRARIHPRRLAGSLRPAQYALLRDAVVEALEAGIAAKGATIDDFRDAEGASGAFQNEFLVHRRAGEPCVECGSPIVKLVVAGRGTYVCERCQPRPRPRRAKRRSPARPVRAS